VLPDAEYISAASPALMPGCLVSAEDDVTATQRLFAFFADVSPYWRISESGYMMLQKMHIQFLLCVCVHASSAKKYAA